MAASSSSDDSVALLVGGGLALGGAILCWVAGRKAS